MAKSSSEFTRRNVKGETRKLSYWCKLCLGQYRQCNRARIKVSNRKYDSTHREQRRLRDKIRYHTAGSSARSPQVLFQKYKRGAGYRNLVFTLSFDQFMTFWQKPCIYGCKIDTIGLDRINNNEGYLLDNIQSMCGDHNQMKMNFSVGRFEQLCRQV